MRRARRARWVAWGACAAAALASATQCGDVVTEIVVVVTTDYVPGDEIDRIDVNLLGPNGEVISEKGSSLSAGELPLTLGVVAGRDLSAAVTIIAVAKLQDREITRTTVKAGMIPRTSKVVPVSLCRSCGASCTTSLDRLEDWTGRPDPAPRCASALDGGADADADPEPKSCPVGVGEPEEGIMAMLTTPRGKRFCIDREEVTQRAYKRFLDAKDGDVSGQAAECEFNIRYFVAEHWSENECSVPSTYFTPDATGYNPVVCVDWCDAVAYCKWNGKRLCGKIGGGGVPPALELFDEELSQWYAACSNGGTTVYPYGNEYNPEFCNGGDRAGSDGTTWNSGAQASCLTKVGGVADMIGNVSELEDACFEVDAAARGDAAFGALDWCAMRGGSARSKVEDDTQRFLRCNQVPKPSNATHRVVTRSHGARDLGFRCCADP